MLINYNRRDFIRKLDISTTLAGIRSTLWSGNIVSLPPSVIQNDISLNDNRWVSINDKIYGAKLDDRSELGRGSNYFEHFTTGQYEITNLDEY